MKGAIDPKEGDTIESEVNELSVSTKKKREKLMVLTNKAILCYHSVKDQQQQQKIDQQSN